MVTVSPKPGLLLLGWCEAALRSSMRAGEINIHGVTRGYENTYLKSAIFEWKSPGIAAHHSTFEWVLSESVRCHKTAIGGQKLSGSGRAGGCCPGGMLCVMIPNIGCVFVC